MPDLLLSCVSLFENVAKAIAMRPYLAQEIYIRR